MLALGGVPPSGTKMLSVHAHDVVQVDDAGGGARADEVQPRREVDALLERLVDVRVHRRVGIEILRLAGPVGGLRELRRVRANPRVVVVRDEGPAARTGVDGEVGEARCLVGVGGVGCVLAGEQHHVVLLEVVDVGPESGLSGVVPVFALAPVARYQWMRPPPVGIVNSLSSTPILRKMHSSVSAPPVEIAVSGMSPSALVARETNGSCREVVDGAGFT